MLHYFSGLSALIINMESKINPVLPDKPFKSISSSPKKVKHSKHLLRILINVAKNKPIFFLAELEHKIREQDAVTFLISLGSGSSALATISMTADVAP